MAERKTNKKSAVVNYITILFLAAFLLLMLTYLMEQRQSAEILDGLRNSVSAMQSVDEIKLENDALKEELNQLEQELSKKQVEMDDLTQTLDEYEEELAEHTQALAGMDWFWQVNEAYVLGRESLCSELMEELDGYTLPLESVTDNGRFSPAHRYLEIRRDLLEE